MNQNHFFITAAFIDIMATTEFDNRIIHPYESIKI